MATVAEKAFEQIATEIANTVVSKMFGATCLKAANGKAGIMLYKNELVFKLPSVVAESVLKLEGASVFEPAPGRPMNGWIVIPQKENGLWSEYAVLAMDYVAEIEPKKTVKKSKFKGN